VARACKTRTPSTMLSPLSVAAEAGNAAEVRALLAGGADVHAKEGPYRRTALHWSGYYGHVAAVEALLAGGADVHAKDNAGRTALHWAVAKGHVAIVEALLAGGADVHAKDMFGETALHQAGTEGHVAAVEALLAGGADVHAKDNNGMTACDLALQRKKHAAVRLFDRANLATAHHPARLPEAEFEEAGRPPIPAGAEAEGAKDGAADMQTVRPDSPRSSEEWEEEATVAGQSTSEAGEDEAPEVVLGEDERDDARPDETPPPAPEVRLEQDNRANEDAADVPALEEDGNDVPNQGGEGAETPGQGREARETAPWRGEAPDMLDEGHDANATPNQGTDAGNDNQYLSAAKANAEVKDWLARFLPRLQKEDAVTYRRHLIEDGFDSEERMRLVEEKDLHYMKIGHKRQLIGKFPDGGL